MFRYVREVLLGQRGGDLARVTEAVTCVTLDDVHTRLRSDRGLGVAQLVVARGLVQNATAVFEHVKRHLVTGLKTAARA